MNDRRPGRRAVLLIPWLLGVAAFAWVTGAHRSEAATSYAATSYDGSGPNAELVARGKELFSSTTAWGQQPSLGAELSGQRLACSSCHTGPAYTDGRTHLISPVGSQPLARRQTPHLFGLGGSAPYSWDGRNATLEAQLKGAIVSPLELNATRPPTPHDLDALAAYLLTLTPPRAQPGVDFDAAKAARGDKLFHELRPVTDPGGEFGSHASASCATCHEGPLLTDQKPHRIWPTPFGDPADIGEVNQDGHTVGFDTPALVGLRFTAPYFHQGAGGLGEGTAPAPGDPAPGDPAAARQALRSVVLPFYNARFQLHFTDAELDDLTEFLLTL